MTPPIQEAHFDWLKYAQIVSWLNLCAGQAKALSVRVFIEELAKFIRTRVSGDLEMSDVKETCDSILKSKSSFGAAVQISRTINSAKTKLLEKYRTDLSVQLESHGFTLVWDKDLETSWKSSFGFGVKFRPEQNLYLRFEFENPQLNGFFWGIKKDSDATPRGHDLWNQIRKLMLENFESGKESEYFPWYSTLPEDSFDSRLKNWSSSELPWYMLIDNGENSLAMKVVKFSCSVRDVFGGNVGLLSAGALLNNQS